MTKPLEDDYESHIHWTLRRTHNNGSLNRNNKKYAFEWWGGKAPFVYICSMWNWIKRIKGFRLGGRNFWDEKKTLLFIYLLRDFFLYSSIHSFCDLKQKFFPLNLSHFPFLLSLGVQKYRACPRKNKSQIRNVNEKGISFANAFEISFKIFSWDILKDKILIYPPGTSVWLFPEFRGRWFNWDRKWKFMKNAHKMYDFAMWRNVWEIKEIFLSKNSYVSPKNVPVFFLFAPPPVTSGWIFLFIFSIYRGIRGVDRKMLQRIFRILSYPEITSQMKFINHILNLCRIESSG